MISIYAIFPYSWQLQVVPLKHGMPMEVTSPCQRTSHAIVSTCLCHWWMCHWKWVRRNYVPVSAFHSGNFFGINVIMFHQSIIFYALMVMLLSLHPSSTPLILLEGTHYHTRNLAPMMLAAKARKTLQPQVTPRLRKGDALIFDYRILHRGKANLSDTVNAKGDSEGCLDETSGEGSDCKDADITDNIFKVGRDRPILVMTFARRWFVDVCNFPKRSVFSL
mmetsp:Transcript_4550/g.8397  ORF Transcript_4550/g.8397 Transcript_4550/m.8397 type:complete len:221 (+) Transcript_4550:158-820(+)